MTKQIKFVYSLTLLFTICNNFRPIMAPKKIYVDFQVYGRVQGVFFRKYTQEQAHSLGVRGWCMNTEKGTVKGSIEGEEVAVNKMKNWLKNTGSPKSRIDKSEFSNEKEITDYTFTDFKIRK